MPRGAQVVWVGLYVSDACGRSERTRAVAHTRASQQVVSLVSGSAQLVCVVGL